MVPRSVRGSVTRFFQTAEFKPKSDLISINAPAQRSRLTFRVYELVNSSKNISRTGNETSRLLTLKSLSSSTGHSDFEPLPGGPVPEINLEMADAPGADSPPSYGAASGEAPPPSYDDVVQNHSPELQPRITVQNYRL